MSIKAIASWANAKGDTKKMEIQRHLQLLAPGESQTKSLERLAPFLANVAEVWEEAPQEQRNKLARCLFQEVWIKDKEVVAVKPQSELKPFSN